MGCGLPCGSDSKESACNARNLCSIPESGRSLGEGNGYPLQYFCLENSMDRGAWWPQPMGPKRVEHNWVILSVTWSQRMLNKYLLKEWSSLKRALKARVGVCSVALVTSDSETPWTVACQASLSMGFPRQEYWSGLPFPPPGDLSNPGIDPASPVAPAFGRSILFHWATKEAHQ